MTSTPLIKATIAVGAALEARNLTLVGEETLSKGRLNFEMEIDGVKRVFSMKITERSNIDTLAEQAVDACGPERFIGAIKELRKLHLDATGENLSLLEAKLAIERVRKARGWGF